MRFDDHDEDTPVTVAERLRLRRRWYDLSPVAFISLSAFLCIVTAALIVMFAGCAPVQKAPPKTAPKLGASLSFPGGGSSSGGGGTVTQGTAAAGSGAWPVALTEDGTNTIVKTADNANKAIRVNVVAGGAAGGTSSSFGAAIPATGTAAGQSDGTNMQLSRVFDGDTGAGTQYVSGSILRKSASGGTVEAGTSTDPLRVDPTGSTTQPVSGTVTVTDGSGPITVDGTVAATQSGGWTVTANAGTNLNTSALVLESTFGRAQGSGTSGQTGPLIQGAVTTAAPSYTTGQTSPFSLTLSGLLRVDGSGVTQPVSGTVAATQSGSWSLAANQSVNVAQINGVTPLMGNGVTGTGSPRVTIASDNTAFTVNVGTFPDNEPVNMAQVAGTAVSVGNGASGTGVQRVTLANDSTGIVNQGGTWTVQPGNTQNTTEWLTKPTPRTVSSANNTGTCTSVGTSSTTVLASNASRKAYGFKAPSTNGVVVFCKLGATATTGAVPFEAGSSWSQDNGAVYTGVIDCITASSTSSICVYEFN